MNKDGNYVSVLCVICRISNITPSVLLVLQIFVASFSTSSSCKTQIFVITRIVFGISEGFTTKTSTEIQNSDGVYHLRYQIHLIQLVFVVLSLQLSIEFERFELSVCIFLRPGL